jgi:plastocyanin
MRALVAATLLMLISGCTTFVDPPKMSASGTLEDLDKAIAATQKDLMDERSNRALVKDLTGYGIFGGTAGAGVSAAYGAASSQILGFVTLGTTSFALNSLYGSRDGMRPYSNGIRALQCVRDQIQALRKPQAIANELDGARSTLRNALAACKDEKEAASKLAEADSIYGGLDAALDLEKAAIRNRVDGIVIDINDQIEKVSPDGPAIAAVGNSIGGTIVGLAPSSSAKGAPLKPLSTGLDIQFADVAKTCDTDAVSAARAGVEAALAKARPLVDKPLIEARVCSVSALPTLAAVALVEGTELTYSGAAATYRIIGGNGYYWGPVWSGKAPEGVRAFVRAPDTLVIEPGTGTPAPGDYRFNIRDGLGNVTATPILLRVPAPLSLSKTELTLKPEASEKIEIAGDAPPFKPSWVAPEPGAAVTFKLDGKTLTVAATKDAAAGTWTLQVTDSKNRTATLKVTVAK